MSNHPKYSVIVPAAGVGKRMAANTPKQYLPLLGKTMIEVTLETLLAHSQIGQIFVVISAEDQAFCRLPVSSHAQVQTVIGGDERVDSVYSGLKAVGETSRWVLVHDAARPCVRHADISNLLHLASENDTRWDGGILAMPVIDTMKQSLSDDEQISHTVNRQGLWHALTPQFFKTAFLIDSIEFALSRGVQITDEASAIEANGGRVKLVNSSRQNIKVTQPEDLALAEYYLTKESHL